MSKKQWQLSSIKHLKCKTWHLNIGRNIPAMPFSRISSPAIKWDNGGTIVLLASRAPVQKMIHTMALSVFFPYYSNLSHQIFC
jgi:hypothetical protein